MQSLLAKPGLKTEGLYNRIAKNSEFEAWFSGSKITDSSGHPMLMFHGTYLDFDAFASASAFHCFTPDPIIAEEHAWNSYSSFKNDAGGASVIIMPVYVRARRPFDPRAPECMALMEQWGIGIPSQYDYGEWEPLEDLEIASRIRVLGFDGIWMRYGGSYNFLAVFSPLQVKSAIANSGRFNSGSESLTDRDLPEGALRGNDEMGLHIQDQHCLAQGAERWRTGWARGRVLL